MSQATGKSLKRLSWETGIPFHKLLNYCQKGQITGAQLHPQTRQWIVYPPCQILPAERENGHSSMARRSTLRGVYAV